MADVFGTEPSVFFAIDHIDSESNAGGCTQAWWDTECPNGTEAETAAAMAKLFSGNAPINVKDGCAFDFGVNTITKVDIHIGVEVGMVAHVIETPVPGIDVPTGRYKITGVVPDAITCMGIPGTGNATVNVIIGGAFPTLQEALDETDATDNSVTIHLQSTPTLAATIDADAGGGNNAKNTFKRIVGFKVAPGDMDRGGTYYESPFEILQNGMIDLTKCVTLDANGGAFESFQIAVDNIVLKNLHFYNTNGAAGILFTGVPINVSIENCRCSDVTSVFATEADFVLVDSCFSQDDITNHHYIVRGIGNVLVGCVANLAAGFNFANFPTAPGMVIGCLTVGGQYGIRCNALGGMYAANNTFYDTSTYGVRIDGGAGIVIVNNIFALAPGAIALSINGAGSFIYNDHNCFIETDGTPLTVGEHVSFFEVPTIGPHSIAADPLFEDTASNDFRLKSNSPCRDNGKPTIDSGSLTMGAYQFPQTRGHGVRR